VRGSLVPMSDDKDNIKNMAVNDIKMFADYHDVNLKMNLGWKPVSSYRKEVDCILAEQSSKLGFHFFIEGKSQVACSSCTHKILNFSQITGFNGIHTSVLKLAREVIAPSLTHIFNLSISTGIFVDDWKTATMWARFTKVMTASLWNIIDQY